MGLDRKFDPVKGDRVARARLGDSDSFDPSTPTHLQSVALDYARHRAKQTGHRQFVKVYKSRFLRGMRWMVMDTGVPLGTSKPVLTEVTC